MSSWSLQLDDVASVCVESLAEDDVSRPPRQSRAHDVGGFDSQPSRAPKVRNWSQRMATISSRRTSSCPRRDELLTHPPMMRR
jgi:hypothetical protein